MTLKPWVGWVTLVGSFLLMLARRVLLPLLSSPRTSTFRSFWLSVWKHSFGLVIKIIHSMTLLLVNLSGPRLVVPDWHLLVNLSGPRLVVPEWHLLDNLSGPRLVVPDWHLLVNLSGPRLVVPYWHGQLLSCNSICLFSITDLYIYISGPDTIQRCSGAGFSVTPTAAPSPFTDILFGSWAWAIAIPWWQPLKKTTAIFSCHLEKGCPTKSKVSYLK